MLLEPSEWANRAWRPPRLTILGDAGGIGGRIKGEGLSLAPFGGGGNQFFSERSFSGATRAERTRSEKILDFRPSRKWRKVSPSTPIFAISGLQFSTQDQFFRPSPEHFQLVKISKPQKIYFLEFLHQLHSKKASFQPYFLNFRGTISHRRPLIWPQHRYFPASMDVSDMIQALFLVDQTFHPTC